MSTSSQQVILEALNSDGRAKTINDLMESLDLTNRAISSACVRLIRLGFIERRTLGLYKITPEGQSFLTAGGAIQRGRVSVLNGGSVRCVKRSDRAKIWTSIRTLAGSGKKFTIDDIMCTLENPQYSNIRMYVKNLADAGYLKKMAILQPGETLTSNGKARYRLVRNNGPKNPIYRPQNKEVFDPNTGEVFPCRI